MYSRLRIIPPSELNAEVLAEEDATPSESRAEPATPASDGDALLSEAAAAVLEMKNNRLTVDDANRQALTQQEIEELKQSLAGKEIIEKILANHAGLDEKTVFSRAKYMLRKRSKYLKRFELLPMQIGYLVEYFFEKEPQRILEMREETLALSMAWLNVHFTPVEKPDIDASGKRVGGGRWLLIDETGGLLVAAMAERMDILYKRSDKEERASHPDGIPESEDVAMANGHPECAANGVSHSRPFEQKHRDFPPPAPTNTITLLHPAVQPNISLLKHFGYDSNIPDLTHPLHTHLKPLSWLQLLHPHEDPTYCEPETVPEAELANWKSGKRGTYYKKRRRWERCKSIVDETREGGFDGLLITSHMDLLSILPHVVPLVRGGGHILLSSPVIEPLVTVMDFYSKERRAAYIQQLAKGQVPDAKDFPVDPRLLLAPTLHTTRVREQQVLPGRTHPVMTAQGGSEGYVLTARKVVPLEGGVEARGNFAGKRRRGGIEAVVDRDEESEQ